MEWIANVSCMAELILRSDSDEGSKMDLGVSVNWQTTGLQNQDWGFNSLHPCKKVQDLSCRSC